MDVCFHFTLVTLKMGGNFNTFCKLHCFHQTNVYLSAVSGSMTR